MGERLACPEMMNLAAMPCDPKLGSISSLRCQKSRRRVYDDNACEVMFSRTILLGDQVSSSSLFELRRARFANRLSAAAPRVASWRSVVEPDGIEPTTSCLQSTRSPS